MSDAFAPRPEHKFSFGLWTVGNRGRDPFGDVVRDPLPPEEAVALLGDVGAWGVNLHDNDLVPIDATPAERDRIVVGGGGARSPLWRQIQANVYGRAVETIAADEGAALGAAILAGVGARVWPSVDAAVDATVRVGSTTAPEPDVVAVMIDRYAHYRRVYPALRAIAGTAARDEAYV